MVTSVFLLEATGQTTNGFESTTLEVTTESTNETEEIITPCIGDGDWQCENGDCISNTTLCDGSIDCTDASDEFRKTCNGSESRPLFGLLLHCMSWSENHEKVCPQICHDAPEFCYYALIAENEKGHDLCVLPEYPEHGSYNIIPTKNETSTKFRLKYDCKEPFVIVEKKIHECIGGNWYNNSDNRYCSKACEISSFKNDNYTFSCPKDIDGSDICKNYVAIDTTVTVKKAHEDLEDQTTYMKNVTVELFCPPSQEINISKDCVDEVDKRQQVFESPTMTKLTQYEADFNKFKSNDTDNPEFKDLVANFNVFEEVVRKELNEMHIMADKCNVSLDLLLSHLQWKKDKGIVN
ncbi:low-density lipoprotein receptor-related protein 1B-like [Cydia splendana]|uniref:low-density lipoprotein receptor-related protein 1B-like n=1 Tax=Cydia splendana TaxID=1100963 RepID=UPI00300C6C07